MQHNDEEASNGEAGPLNLDEAEAPLDERVVAPPPFAVRDLAEACVRFVERAIGVRLDYTAETLPLLDHYLQQAKASAIARPETVPLVVDAAGAYFGEVVRRRHASHWRADGDDAATFRLEFEQLYLVVSPVDLVRDALFGGEEDGESDVFASAGGIELGEDDRKVAEARLAEIAPVSEAEFYSVSMRLEVIDIVVDSVHAWRLSEGEPDLLLRPVDYERS